MVKTVKIIKHFMSSKKIIFFSCMYEMVDITKEAFENNDIELIIDGVNTLWLNERHIEKKIKS